MFLGVTGNIGTGKSTVVDLFQQYDDVVIHSADDMTKKALNTPNGQDFIKSRFGGQYIVDGNVDYKLLGERVFSNPDDLRDLTDYSHPIAKDWIQKNYKKNKINVVEAAILFEMEWDSWMDCVIYVSCSPDIQWDRLRNRGMNDEDIVKRLKHQLTISPATKIKRSTYHVDNSLSVEVLTRRVEKIMEELRKE